MGPTPQNPFLYKVEIGRRENEGEHIKPIRQDVPLYVKVMQHLFRDIALYPILQESNCLFQLSLYIVNGQSRQEEGHVF